MSSELSTSDCFIIITPEWGGMVTPGLKNFFLMCDQGELAHKPALIVSISSGRGGSYPVSELRTSSYKNTRICYLPEHIIIEHVGEVLNNKILDPSKKDDFYIKQRLHYSIDLLCLYAENFIKIRGDNISKLDKFPNGM